jgi:alpha-tubulin suppressor-like RCC1 family protein
LHNVVDAWCGGYHTITKLKKGNSFTYFAWGLNTKGQLGINSFKSEAYPVEIKKLRGKNIKKVAAGTEFSIFLTEEGEVYGCGQN